MNDPCRAYSTYQFPDFVLSSYRLPADCATTEEPACEDLMDAESMENGAHRTRPPVLSGRCSHDRKYGFRIRHRIPT